VGVSTHQAYTPPGFMLLAEAAVWARVSTRTMRRWIDQGLPRYQAGPGGKVLIRPCDIEAFLERTKPDLNAMVEEVLAGLDGR